jgi:hypothetical protein
LYLRECQSLPERPKKYISRGGGGVFSAEFGENGKGDGKMWEMLKKRKTRERKEQMGSKRVKYNNYKIGKNKG